MIARVLHRIETASTRECAHLSLLLHDRDGSISRAKAAVVYRFTPVCGAFVGYDWFKLDARRGSRDGSLAPDHRFKGTVAGVSCPF